MLCNCGEYWSKGIDRSAMLRLLASLLVGVLLFCALLVQPGASEAAAQQHNRIIRVGYFLVNGFQEYDKKTDTYSGYSYEFLMAIAAYGNWQYEFVPCATFSEAYEKLEKGEIDLLNDVGKRDDRNIEYSTLNAGDGCSYLLMREGDNRVAFNDWQGIAKLKLGLDKGSAHSYTLLKILKEHGVEPQTTWFEDEDKLFKAWNDGVVDAVATHSDTAIAGHAVMAFYPRLYYLAATKGNTKLIADIDYAIQAMRANAPGFEARLQDKYYNRISRNYTVLTPEEKQYVLENPVVNVLYIPDWYPISYKNEKGEFAGPFRQVYKLLQERTGLKFNFVPLDDEKTFKGIVETYNCYMLAEHPADYAGARKFDVKLTQTFVNAALVEVTKGALKKGDTLALVKGDSLSTVVQTLFGDAFKYVMVKNIDESMEKVQSGEVDGTVLMSYESEYYQSQRKYRNLIYTIVNSGSYGFALAVSNQANPLLYSIIVKGLNSISAGEVNNIFNAMTQEMRKPNLWDTVQDNPLPFTAAGIVLAGLLVLAISSFYFGQKIKNKNEALVRANKATNQFFASMSHDMRTPMNGILGIAELSKSDTDATTLHGEMDKIKESGKYLLSLINDTLDFQRIESGNLQLQKEIVNYKQVFANIVELVSPTARNKKLKINIDSTKAVPDCYIWADPVRVKQIFINLISNAIKFTPAGGTVSVEYEPRTEDGEKLCDRFYIRDTGVGMTQDFIDHKMFKPFNQEHNEVTDHYAGSGLGLSIVKNLVDLMGGTIRVESERGTGSTFIVDLDFAKVSAEDLKKHQDQLQGNVGASLQELEGTRILLVEDHPMNAEIASRLLRKVGCEVQWVKNGQEALEAYSKEAAGYYAIILMDIRMPIMDGFEATRAIRAVARPDAATIPILAMTANAYESDIKECLDAGMNGHVAKPIEPPKLYAAIAKYTQQTS